ncbi:b119.1 [Murid betaherpesvirus 8]|uniref:B119.1 n=1 Tax=Rat cytomegalovirus (isolate England) TaxID=1261657 RepID=A0A0E3X3L0_RCMVE|nr:b119.1 [Murid betaherpesvirus 8]WPH25021.1 b119.1 [Murid betaherpesvirus 8]WPH25155.1 b119.1 [Murid betaherpesvirus 8]
MRISSIMSVLCLFTIVETRKCNITVVYSYYDYNLNASCFIICPFPIHGRFDFREKTTTERYGETPGTYTALFSLSATGSFWGEYVDCRLTDNSLICVARITVNVTISIQCIGANGIWPPFEGPFVTDDQEYINFVIPTDKVYEKPKLGGKKPVYYGTLHLKQKYPPSTKPTTDTLYIMNVSCILMTVMGILGLLTFCCRRYRHARPICV